MNPSPSSGWNPDRRGFLMALLASFALAWFAGLDYRDLIRPDEGRYAEIAREMIASGDWLTPRLNGFKYFEKPALQYWATAAAFSLFGVDAWTARLWTALTGFLGVLLVHGTGRRLFGPAEGLAAAAVTASSLLYVFMGHLNTLDMGLGFFLTLGICAFMAAQADTATARQRRNAMWVAWAAIALAVLSKGLVALVLPGATVAAYVLWQRDWALLRRLHWGSGLLVFLLITAPWLVAVSLRNPEFFHFFFIHEHFERFLTKVHGRYEPPWYFIPVLLAGMLPWTLSLFPALAGSLRKVPGHFQPARFLLAWCACVFLFFSASGSKLPSYILPMTPALALLIGPYLVRATTRALLWQWLPIGAVAIAVLVLAPSATGRADAEQPLAMLEAYVPWLLGAGAALLAAVAAAAWLAWRGMRPAAVLCLAGGALLAGQLPIAGHQQLSPVYSAHDIVETIRPQLRPDAPFYVVNTFDHTLPFYLGRTVTMVRYQDELETAIGWEPGKFIPHLDGFARSWLQDRGAFAMFAPADWEAFRSSHPAAAAEMVEIARDPRRVIVKKP